MTKKYEIILKYIQDLSVEVPSCLIFYCASFDLPKSQIFRMKQNRDARYNTRIQSNRHLPDISDISTIQLQVSNYCQSLILYIECCIMDETIHQ